MSLSVTMCYGQNKSQGLMLTEIPSSFQDKEYGLGVSACYAGSIGDELIIAGGCNFPEKGRKKYYSTIYAAKPDDAQMTWRVIGQLPRPLAYGITVTAGDSLVLVGGCNAEGSVSDVYSIHINPETGMAVVHTLPSMPSAVDNAAGAFCDNKIFVVGGNVDGKPSADILSLDMTTNNWSRVASVPGNPRVQPVCACCDGRLYVFGGFFMNGEDSRVATDGYSYDLATKAFRHLPAPRDAEGNEVTLSGGAAITCNGRILCTGGVFKDIFLDAISGRYTMVEQSEYLNQSVEWYRFNGRLFAFDPHADSWQTILDVPHSPLSRAGAALVFHSSAFYYIGGELKPGVRTSKTIKFNIDK